MKLRRVAYTDKNVKAYLKKTFPETSIPEAQINVLTPFDLFELLAKRLSRKTKKEKLVVSIYSLIYRVTMKALSLL